MFIVLETFNADMISIESDEEGNTLYFDTVQDALEHAKEVQNPVIVELPYHNNIVRGDHTLMNVVLLPDKDSNPYDIPYGKENRIYLNGKYISRWTKNEYDDYTITWDAYCDIINGLRIALPGLLYEDILLDEDKLSKILGRKWKEYEKNGALWIKIEQYLSLQAVE